MSQITGRVRSLMSRFRLTSGFVRAHERRECACIGELYFVDRGFGTRGIVDEISRGGMRFRPGHSYILERSGDAVSVRFGTLSLNAVVVNVSSKGYGLKLRELLTSEEVDDIVERNDAFLDRAA